MSESSFESNHESDLGEEDLKEISVAVEARKKSGIGNLFKNAVLRLKPHIKALLSIAKFNVEHHIPKDKSAWLEFLISVAKKHKVNIEYLSHKEVRKVIIRARPNLAHKSIPYVFDPYLPDCARWSPQEVGQWLKSMGWGHLEKTFVGNFISGRRLPLIDCSALNKMGLTDLSEMQQVAKAIRHLLGIPDPNQLRPIMRIPALEKFLRWRVTTGRKHDNVTFEKFCQMEGINFDYVAHNKNAEIPCQTEVLVTTPEKYDEDDDDEDDDQVSLRNAPTVEFLVRNAYIRNITINQIMDDILKNVFLPKRERQYGKDVWGELKRGIGEGYDDLHLYFSQDKLEFATGIAHQVLDELNKTVTILNDVSLLQKYIGDRITADEIKIFQDAGSELLDAAAPIAALLALGELDLENIFRQEPEFNQFVDGIVRKAERKTNKLVPNASEFVNEVILEAWTRIPEFDLSDLEPHLADSLLRMATEVMTSIEKDKDKIVDAIVGHGDENEEEHPDGTDEEMLDGEEEDDEEEESVGGLEGKKHSFKGKDQVKEVAVPHAKLKRPLPPRILMPLPKKGLVSETPVTDQPTSKELLNVQRTSQEKISEQSTQAANSRQPVPPSAAAGASQKTEMSNIRRSRDRTQDTKEHLHGLPNASVPEAANIEAVELFVPMHVRLSFGTVLRPGDVPPVRGKVPPKQTKDGPKKPPPTPVTFHRTKVNLISPSEDLEAFEVASEALTTKSRPAFARTLEPVKKGLTPFVPKLQEIKEWERHAVGAAHRISLDRDHETHMTMTHPRKSHARLSKLPHVEESEKKKTSILSDKPKNMAEKRKSHQRTSADTSKFEAERERLLQPHKEQRIQERKSGLRHKTVSDTNKLRRAVPLHATVQLKAAALKRILEDRQIQDTGPEANETEMDLSTKEALQVWESMKEEYNPNRDFMSVFSRSAKTVMKSNLLKGMVSASSGTASSARSLPPLLAMSKYKPKTKIVDVITVNPEFVQEMKERRDGKVEEWARKASEIEDKRTGYEKEQAVRMTADKVVQEILTMALTNLLLSAQAGKKTEKVVTALKEMKKGRDAPKDAKDITLWQTALFPKEPKGRTRAGKDLRHLMQVAGATAAAMGGKTPSTERIQDQAKGVFASAVKGALADSHTTTSSAPNNNAPRLPHALKK